MGEAEADAAAERIMQALPSLRRGSLEIWAVVFGRPGDNIHTAVNASATDDVLSVQFNQGELLQVWEPLEWVFDADDFRIGNARRVRWQWYSYGQPRTPEFLYFKDYVRTRDGLSISERTFRHIPCRPELSAPAVWLT